MVCANAVDPGLHGGWFHKAASCDIGTGFGDERCFLHQPPPLLNRRRLGALILKP